MRGEGLRRGDPRKVVHEGGESSGGLGKSFQVREQHVRGKAKGPEVETN